MSAPERRLNPGSWIAAYAVDLAFWAMAAGWLIYVLRITRGFSFWSDDLPVLDQAGSWSGLVKDYNGALSLVSTSVYRVSGELFGLSYTPIMVAGALSLVAVPVSYFVTTRRQLGPTLAAVLALTLLWYDGMSLRPAGLNHYLALVGGIICAAALNRGRRADGILAAALVFSLCAAGGGLIVAGACFAHNVLVRPHLRRWLVVVVPSALWAAWWLLVADGASPAIGERLTIGESVRVVRDLCLAPFYHAAFGFWPLAAVLVAAFVAYGVIQLRHGLVAGANFLVWSGAVVLWGVALVQSRGSFADPQIFRYSYLAMGFLLLAVVPRRPVTWPARFPLNDRRWLAAAGVVVLLFGGVRALVARAGLQGLATEHTELGREAEGTILALKLGPEVIPNDTPMTFFSIGIPHGTAGRLRKLLDRYGSPFETTSATIDQDLVDRYIARAQPGGLAQYPGCKPLTQPVLTPGFIDLALGLFPIAPPAPGSPSRYPIQLWSPRPYSIEVRRYGDTWAHLADEPAGANTYVVLPYLDTKNKPWQIRANGACDIPPPAPAKTKPGT